MNVLFILLVLIPRSYAFSNRMWAGKNLCSITANYCKIQCKFGDKTFQKKECKVECDKNNITCEYLYSSNCIVPTDKTHSLNTTHVYNDSTPCFHDYAPEYFCRHIYDPCQIAANGSETLNQTCAKRLHFCQCGLKYYLSQNKSLFLTGTTPTPTPPPVKEEHTEPIADVVDSNMGLFLPDVKKGRGKRDVRYSLSHKMNRGSLVDGYGEFDYPRVTL